MMEPALDVINRALQGDPESRSFLERTTSIYVLDVNDTANAKTYGCWNFIHQGMNEVERYEARRPPAHSEALNVGYTNGGHSRGNLVGHARMMAAMALRVARRSPSTDKTLVATCVLSTSHYHGLEKESKLRWLVDLNLELREIVIGRIAAMVFDFSFHRQTGLHGQSAFADRVVMDMFCSILSANAVASGPLAVKPFATEWIIPSSRNLPPFSVASVVLHLASEGLRKSAPVGTKDTLQQLSSPVMNVVLVPTLADAVTGDESSGSNGTTLSRESRSQVAAMCLRAMKMWCEATDLSLPQIKHVCSKVDINLVDVLSDAMYSDSHALIDSLAELIELTAQTSDENVMTMGRMSQVRHIIQVDELSFRAQFSPFQLKMIELHEMAPIVEELISAIGMQRFRFTERQNNGDYDVCRNLTRIAATVCETWLDISAQQEQMRQSETGAVNLLVKAAGHPSFHICAIALKALTRIMPNIPSLSRELLPTLQRRAITPHYLEDGMIRLDASDICDISFHEFQNFRANVLSDAIIVCWRGCDDHFMDSCTSAVEEFCSSSQPSIVSLQLEAALFCMEQIASVAFDSQQSFAHTEQMKRVFVALATKPPSLMINPLTREGMCRFTRKFSKWCTEQNGLEVMVDLVISSFRASISLDSNKCMLGDHQVDTLQSSVHEASKALKVLMCRSPGHFSIEAGVLCLNDLWATVYAILDRNDEKVINTNDRICLCLGFGHVLASLPDDRRLTALETLTLPSIRRLDDVTLSARNEKLSPQLSHLLMQVGSEIRIITAICQSLISSDRPDTDSSNEVMFEFSQNRIAPRPELVSTVMQKAWPSISHAAEAWTDDENVAIGLSTLLSGLTPPTCEDETSLKLLLELCSLSTSMFRRNPNTSRGHVEIVFGFACMVIGLYGDTVEKQAVLATNGHNSQNDAAKIVTDMLLVVVNVIEVEITSGQRNGENGLVSEPTAGHAIDATDELLSAILTFLHEALRSCPVVLLQLFSTTKTKTAMDAQFRQLIDSAVSSICDSVSSVSRSSIAFLTTLIQSRGSPHEWLQLFASEAIGRVQKDMIDRLILGLCGKLEYETLSSAVELLVRLLQATSSSSETESYLVSSLRQGHFLLGDPARAVTLTLLLGRSAVHLDQSVNLVDLVAAIEDIWQLHQVEDVEALPGSDEVARFVMKYNKYR